MKEIKFKIYDGDCEVTIEVTQEKLEAIFMKIVDFAKKTGQVSGEGIGQDDDCQIESPVLLGDIWDDIIKPETEWKD